MTTPSSRRGRPRDESADVKILEAALVLLRESGPGAVHVDGVAARAGVARTTVYRRYADRRALLVAALSRIADRGPVPTDPAIEDRFRRVLARVRDVVDDGLGRGGVAAVLSDADPEFTQALRDVLAAQLAPLAGAIAEDVEAGRLHRDVDPDTVLTLAFGAYLGELLRHGGPRADWLDRSAATLARLVAAD